MRGKAIRRHHYRRLKNKRRRYWFGDEEPMSPRILGMVTATPHPCSCAVCGGPRRIGELTRQEIRAKCEVER